jgi:ataxia telangiectasia mutated family protein
MVGPTSKDGAHLHYARSEDLTTKESLEHVMKLDKLLCLTDRTSAFLEICARFPPVFRHFFLERYSSPSLWFEKRLNYTRSVAASSMVGYILGIQVV